MSEVGARLKEEREARGLVRSEVSRDTGIFIHHLSALEHGNFDELPDDETVAGYVRTYAEYLGFVPDEPVAEFCAERGIEVPARTTPEPAAEPPPVSSRGAPSQASPRSLWPWLAVGALVIFVLVWVGMRGEAEPKPAAPEPAAPEGVEAAPEEPVPEPQAPETTLAVEPVPDETESPPVQVPVQAPGQAPTASAPTLSVTEHGVGTGVENYRLVGESDRFDVGTRVWYWTRVRGGARGDEIHHVWIHESGDVYPVELPVGSANWRTQSAKTLYGGAVGRWTVEARDVDGNVLARSEFTCVR